MPESPPARPAGPSACSATSASGRTELRVVELPPSRRVDAAALAAEAWDLPPAPGVIEARLSAADSRVVAALDRGGRIVGVATASILGGGRASADETVVQASWRGHGIAAALLQELSVSLRRCGVWMLEGESSGQRRKELEFFQRQGFCVTGVSIAYGIDGFADGETIFRTEKRL